MPLQISTESPEAVARSLAASGATPSYLVVYASETDGRMWCGDCRDAEPFVNKKFSGWSEVVKVVYAGQKDEWKRAENPWRQSPFLVTKLPTIIKVTDKRWEMLVEADVYDQDRLDAFVGNNK